LLESKAHLTISSKVFFLFLVFQLLIIVNLFHIGCSKFVENEIENKYMAKGFIQEVKSESLLYYDFFILKDDDGENFMFERGDSNIVGFSASHLREHMLFGLPIVVEYYIIDDRYVVINLYD